jgi:hypothetical protein
MTDLFPRVLRAGPRSGFVSTALGAARSFLIEPVEGADERIAAFPAKRPTVAVFGLARGCGSTVVSRALGAELAARDVSGACAVASETGAAGIPLATPAASRLARALDDMPGGARAVGRLCLVGGAHTAALVEALQGLAPLVIDAGSAAIGGVPACVADRTVIVTTPSMEPALARVAAECVARVGPEPILVVNRSREGRDGGAEGRDGAGETAPADALPLPVSRMGAQLALGGREVRGELGRAIAALADRCKVGD